MAEKGRRSGLRIVGGLLVGLIAGGVAAAVISVVAASVGNISQMEGAYAMGVVFFWIPLGAVVGGIAGAVLGARRRGKGKPGDDGVPPAWLHGDRHDTRTDRDSDAGASGGGDAGGGGGD